MARNMIIRLGIDASDFQKKMQRAGASAESTGQRIRKSMTINNLGAEVSKIMGWSGAATGVGSINAGNFSQAQNQLGILRSYRDQLAGAGFDDYQFGLVSERIKALEYDLNEYTQSLNRAADAEREAAGNADDFGDEAGKASLPVAKTSRSLRNLFNSGSRLNAVPGFIRRIGDSAGNSSIRLERMVRTIRNVSVVSFGLRIARGLFGELGTVMREYISQNETLQGQVNGLKAGLGQTLAPAIGIVTNALSYLLPYALGVSNAIGQLMGALFGSGWAAAAAGANKTAAATGGAAKAQKELNKQLMSFDQINRIDGQKDSGGGGGAGTAITPIEAKTPAWMERFKKSFSDLFNSSEFQSSNIGGKIGMALQTGIDWLGAEGMNFDWRGAGARLRENLDSFLGSGWVESLSHSLGIYLGGFADMVIGFLGPQWGELETAYRNEGWQGAAAYILGMTAGLIGNGISGLFTKVLAPIFTGVADFFRENGSYSIAGFFDGCAQAMTNVGSWIKENITDPIVNWVKNLLGIHSPSTVFSSIGENCMDGLGGGLSKGVVGVLQKLTDLKDRVLGIADTLRSAFSFNWQMPHLRLPHLSVEWDPIDNILAQFFGVTAFPRLSVQWFAKGGILNGAQIFGRMGSTLLGGGERGREAILPLDTNTGWMDVLASRISQSLSADGGDVNATINLILDGDVLTTYVMKGIRRRARGGTATG
jgi:hypothetical protein